MIVKYELWMFELWAAVGALDRGQCEAITGHP